MLFHYDFVVLDKRSRINKKLCFISLTFLLDVLKEIFSLKTTVDELLYTTVELITNLHVSVCLL